MIALAILVLLVILLVIAIGEAMTNRYRQLWLDASALLTESDARNEELRHKATLYAMSLSNKAETARKLKQANAQLGAEVEDLKVGFAELHELGVELVAEREQTAGEAIRAIRDAAAAAAVEKAAQRARDAHEQIMRQLDAPPPKPSGRVEQLMRMMQGGN